MPPKPWMVPKALLLPLWTPSWIKTLVRLFAIPALFLRYVGRLQPQSWPFAQGMICYWYLVLCCRLFARKCRSERRKHGKPTDKMSILLVGDAFPPKVDGVCTFAVHTIQELKAKGHKVNILTSVTETPTLFDCPVTRLPGTRLDYCPEHSISVPLPWTCLSLLYRVKPDVVHLFEYSFVSPFMAFYCWLADVPTCWSHHTRCDLYIDTITFPWYIPRWFQKGLYATTDPLFTQFATAHLPVCKYLHDKLKYRFGYENVK